MDKTANIRPTLRRNEKVTEAEIEICQDIYNRISPMKGFDASNTFLIALSLAEFAVIFREDNGIQAMLDYIVWAIKNEKSSGILATVMHDLNGRNDKFMSPRTSEYLGANDGMRLEDDGGRNDG